MRVNNIVQYWDKKELPGEIERLTDTWKTMNPSMSHDIFNKDSAAAYILEYYGKFALDLFMSVKLPAMQSDMFRVAYCLNDGGFYADAASVCESSIEPLLGSVDELLLMRRVKGTICNGFIAVERNNPILFDVWTSIMRNVLVKDINKVWLATGPGAYKNALAAANDSSYTIVEELEMKENYFKLIGNLAHKKKENHWTTTQNTQSIYHTVEAL